MKLEIRKKVKFIIDDKMLSVLTKYIKNTNSKVFDKIARDLIK